MRTDLDPAKGSEKQNPVAHRDHPNGISPAAGSSRAIFAIVGVSLAAHGCLILALLFFDGSGFPSERIREIPVELVQELTEPERKEAAASRGEAPRPAPPPSPQANGKERADSRASLEAKTPDQAIARKLFGAPPPGWRLPFDMGPERFRAVAVPLPSETGGDGMSYKLIVFGLLTRVKKYPPDAVQRGAKGIAVIRFALSETGGVETVSLVRSSGDAELDAESLDLVKRAAPFPPPPPGAERAFAAEVAFGMGQ